MWVTCDMKFILVLVGVVLSWTLFSYVSQDLSKDDLVIGVIALIILTVCAAALVFPSLLGDEVDESGLIDFIAVPIARGWVIAAFVAVLNIALQMLFGLPT